MLVPNEPPACSHRLVTTPPARAVLAASGRERSPQLPPATHQGEEEGSHPEESDPLKSIVLLSSPASALVAPLTLAQGHQHPTGQR